MDTLIGLENNSSHLDNCNPVSQKPAIVFEIASEVCFQIGGIYRVIHSKVPSMIAEYGREGYFLIGPLLQTDYGGIFRAHSIEELQQTYTGACVAEMQRDGIEIQMGTWLIEGNPQVILINPDQRLPQLQNIQRQFFKDYNLPSNLAGAALYLTFGEFVRQFFSLFCKMAQDRFVIHAHFHEYQTGCALLGIKKYKLRVKTIFTTHSTILGRFLSSTKQASINCLIQGLNVHNALKRLPPSLKFPALMEILTAKHCDVFTTVSSVACYECEAILGRKPDFITRNGLNHNEITELVQQERNIRNQINEFITKRFDLNKAPSTEWKVLFTAGRYELINKGLDIFIAALGIANDRLKTFNSSTKIIAFVVTDSPSKAANPLKSLYYALREKFAFITTKTVSKISTHDNGTEFYSTEIANAFYKANLFNQLDDPVKIIYHPEFINHNSPCLKMDYLSFASACDLGVFPSIYEPWGYTAAESICLGIPTVLSSTSGFGDYLREKKWEKSFDAYILNMDQEKKAIVEDLANYILEFTARRNHSTRTPHKEISQWSEFIKDYLKAYQLQKPI